jgi:hypothetical protein
MLSRRDAWAAPNYVVDLMLAFILRMGKPQIISVLPVPAAAQCHHRPMLSTAPILIF